MSELQQLDTLDDDEADANDVETPPGLKPPSEVPADVAALEARIADLQRQVQQLGTQAGTRTLAAADPDEVLVGWIAPLHPVEGSPYRINGEVPKVYTRRVAEQILSDHGRAMRIEKERLMNRGSEIAYDRMDPFDTQSRLARANRGRHVL